MVDENGIISIVIDDEHWDVLTSDKAVREFAYRGSLSHKYNAGVKRVQLVRKGSETTLTVWKSKTQ